MSDIFIIGDKLEDVYIEVIPKKISAEAPIMVYEAVEEPKRLPGGAGNIEALLRQLGHKVELLSGYSRFLLDPAKPHLREKRWPRKTRIMSGGHQLMRFDSDDRVESPCAGCYLKKVELDVFDAIVVADYQKGSISDDGSVALMAAYLRARHRPSPIYVHTKGNPSRWLSERLLPPPIMFVNREEYARYLDPYDHFELVIRTLGPAGAELVRYGEPFYWVPSFAEAIISVNGAGDAFMAGFIHEHLANGVPQKALLVGSVAAALTCGRPYCGYIKGTEELYGYIEAARGTADDFDDPGESGSDAWSDGAELLLSANDAEAMGQRAGVSEQRVLREAIDSDAGLSVKSALSPAQRRDNAGTGGGSGVGTAIADAPTKPWRFLPPASRNGPPIQGTDSGSGASGV